MTRALNDKEWWYRNCLAHPDPVTLARARELYPSMFYADGELCDPRAINFNARDRVDVPARDSAAYREAGLVGADGRIVLGEPKRVPV